MKTLLAKHGINNTLVIADIDNQPLDNNYCLIVPDAEKLTLCQTTQLLNKSLCDGLSIVLFDNRGKIGHGNALQVLRKNNIKEYDFTHGSQHKNEVNILSVASQKMRYNTLANDYAMQ